MTNAIKIMHPKDVHLEALPYKYPMRNAVTLDAEIRQIEICMSKGYQHLTLQEGKDEWLSVVGFGPSLRLEWQNIKPPVMTVSGAHDFLLERGVTPDYHVECDGRDHKVKHLQNPCTKTKYLMASICSPQMWEQLQGCEVITWHNANGQHVVDWIEENDDGSILVAGGSNVGLSAIHIAGILGYKNFRMFGFDGNFSKGVRHAGKHYGPPQKLIKRHASGRDWDTTPQMSNACDEFTWIMNDENLNFEVHGDCLLADVIKDALRGNVIL